MNTIQFEPKITTEPQIDWRRRSTGADADMFTDMLADQMKRRADADRQDLDAAHRERSRRHAPDPLSGRPARAAIAHHKTLHGEARTIDESTERRLADRDREQGVSPAADEPNAFGEKTADAATTDEHSEQAGDGKQQSPDGTVAAVQPTDQKTPGCAEDTAEAGLGLPAPEGQPTDAKDAAAGGNPVTGDGTGQSPAEAAMAADLSGALSLLNTGEGGAANAAGSSGAVTQEAASTPIANRQPVLPLAQDSVPVADPTPPAQPQAARAAIDTKIRAGTPTRANASVPEPSSANAQQSAPSHATTAFQPVGASESGSSGEFDQSFSPDGSGPGWALHLAQGAGGKRTDFITQLRQHLQNLPAHEQVAVHIQRALREGTGRFSIQLSPAELGRIHVKLEIDEDKRVTAAVTVERPGTLELLQRDIKGLERALHDAGLTMEGGDLSFSLGQGSDQDFAQDLNQSAASVAGRSASDAQADGEQPDGQAAGIMDTAAGMVNLQV